MKFSFQFLLVALLLSSCSWSDFLQSNKTPTLTPESNIIETVNGNTIIKVDEFTGVIFQNDEDWVPTTKDVFALEKQLGVYLQQKQDLFHGSTKPIKERLPEYKRQYWGVFENEKKVIFVNCFCRTSIMDWQNTKVFTLDGGDCYFKIKFDLETGTFFDLTINGEA
jgi:hypothetical protein